MELEKPTKGKKSPSFRWALARAFGLEYAKHAVLILMEVILTFLIHAIFTHFYSPAFKDSVCIVFTNCDQLGGQKSNMACAGKICGELSLRNKSY